MTNHPSISDFQMAIYIPRVSNSFLLCIAIVIGSVSSSSAQEDDWFSRGGEIYSDQCATCHGDDGAGVEGAYERPLQGDLSRKRLQDYIAQTMPEDDPEMCVGEEADDVTRYMMQAFYTKEAQLRNNPPEIMFSRLTVEQYSNAVTDLFRPFLGEPAIGEPHGLNGSYYPTKDTWKDLAFKRVDKTIDFDFGNGTPDKEKLKDNEQFSISWSGTLIAPATGSYQLILVTKNGVQLHFNEENGESSPLIDNRVADGTTEHAAMVKLRAGRRYPFSISFFKYQEDYASIRFEWQPPHRPRELVQEKYLSTGWAPSTLMLTTEFPPDDSSVGYERGTSISESWDRATTRAAVETLEFADSHFEDLTGYDRKIRKSEKKLDAGEKLAAERDRTKAFCQKFLKTAFRGELTVEEKQFYLEAAFEKENNPRQAMRRIVLMALKSPQFLYVPRRGTSTQSEFAAAEKMALGFWDSIPDEILLNAALKGELASEQALYDQAWRMQADLRTRTKLAGFFHHWLELDRAAEATKDPSAFPGFDSHVIASLSESLEMAINDIVWSEESDFRELLNSDRMYVDSRIAEFYRIDKSADTEFEKVKFEPDRRAGILTHPYLMTGLAYHKNTSPIHRGVFVAKSLLGRSLKPPPVDVEPLSEEFDPTLTTRQRVIHQTKEIACQSCHSVINPLGFSFENYDAVGRFRDKEKDQKIDSSSDYETPDGEVIKFNGARDLAEFLVKSEDTHRNFVEQLFQYFAKQPLAAYGPEKIEQLTNSFRSNSFNIKNLLVEMAVVVAQHELKTGNKQELSSDSK